MLTNRIWLAGFLCVLAGCGGRAYERSCRALVPAHDARADLRAHSQIWWSVGYTTSVVVYPVCDTPDHAYDPYAEPAPMPVDAAPSMPVDDDPPADDPVTEMPSDEMIGSSTQGLRAAPRIVIRSCAQDEGYGCACAD